MTKAADSDWFSLKPAILAGIMDHYTSGLPILEDDGATEIAAEDDDEIVVQIKELIETRVRPAVAQDGGDIVFHKFQEGAGLSGNARAPARAAPARPRR